MIATLLLLLAAGGDAGDAGHAGNLIGAMLRTASLEQLSFTDTVDVVGTTATVSSAQTLAPVDAIASRELDQLVPGQGFAGAVRLLPSVLPTTGGVSIKGGRPGQAGVQLEMATLVDPASGLARVVLPDGAIESVNVLPNPYAVEYGRFASGLVVIQSRRARDQWKFRANRFGPGIRNRNDTGFRIESYNPRMEVGGPIVKDRVYLEQSLQARYTIGNLSSRPEDEQPVTKALSTFTRVDASVSPRHLLVATVGVFPASTTFATVGAFTPPEASVNFNIFGKQAALTERTIWTDRTVGETTFQWYESRTDTDPQGTLPMHLQPDLLSGNYFNRQHRITSSYQFIHAVTGHRESRVGTHVFKIGVDLLRTRFDGTSDSHTLQIERTDGTLARRLDFSGGSAQFVSGTEAAVFAQDRLQVNPRWYVEAGLRLDRDGVLGNVNLSPRIGTAVLLEESGKAVVRGGWGVFVERTPSTVGAFASFETAVDTRFLADGTTPLGPGVFVAHTVAPDLQTPLSRTWDASFDYRFNDRWAMHVGTLHREARHEFLVVPVSPERPEGAKAERQLSSDGQSSYHDVELTAHYTRNAVVDVEATYTRANAVGDLNALTSAYDSVLAPTIGDNAYTTLGTDVPHRLLVRGRVMPRPKWLAIGIFEWRTGVPYSIVNEMLDFVGPRNAPRYPRYARLELGLERRIKVWRFQPWVGIRVNNVLNAFLPDEVQNNTGSPFFGQFFSGEPFRVRGAVRFER